jgi:hypothetical protein
MHATQEAGGSNSSSFVGAEAVAKMFGKTASHVFTSEQDCRNVHFLPGQSPTSSETRRVISLM